VVSNGAVSEVNEALLETENSPFKVVSAGKLKLVIEALFEM
jgi:hypothetical protein